MDNIDRMPGGPLDPPGSRDPLIGEEGDPDELRDEELREDIGIADKDVHGTVEED